MEHSRSKPLVAIACGGTGGHLFPGLAVAQELAYRGCRVTLLVSPKEVDQEAVKSAQGFDVVTLPAVALNRARLLQFSSGFWKSFRAARKLFRREPPQAVLAMGGFTSAPPILAGKACGAATFLHESNTIPGKANRWLSHVVDAAFVGFSSAATRLQNRNVFTTGTPVRQQFQPADAAACRMALGLQPHSAVLLIMGGSQGASGINDLVLQALPHFVRSAPELQFLHLTGANDLEGVRAAYAAQRCQAVTRPFLTEMELALGAATVAVSRAGASSLAELAAMRVPAILVPYPAAADDHQLHNARAFAEGGAASLLQQKGASGERLTELVLRLVPEELAREGMRTALARWHSPDAAQQIAEQMLAVMSAVGVGRHPSGEGSLNHQPSVLRNQHFGAT